MIHSMTLRTWLQDGDFALALSSGFFGFFAHCGMLSVLEDEGLLPRRISGSSAGALVGVCWAAGVGASELGETLCALKREDFWDPAWGWGLLRGELFARQLHALLPVQTFADCSIPATVSVYNLRQRCTEVLDKDLLVPAIRASCAVPLLFHPVRINGAFYWDGGIADRPGLAGMPQGERVLFHHLASRSPWRRPNSPAMQIPQRNGMVTLVCEGLPRVGPFHLERGIIAWQMARLATQKALERPISEQMVCVEASP